MRLYNKDSIKDKRRSLRKSMTQAEIALWTMIKGKQLNGVRFLRQYSIGNYIVDFYSPKHHLAIELDGQPHFDDYNIKRDNQRTEYLLSVGVRVLRFENFEVFDYPQRTLDEIEKYLHNNEIPDNMLQK